MSWFNFFQNFYKEIEREEMYIRYVYVCVCIVVSEMHIK
jgi:hypothetical protein